jgi:hypothetical protein
VKYSPRDIALLEDPVKHQLYVEAHSSGMAPRWREVAKILSTKSALMEQPPPRFLDSVFPGDLADWTKFSAGSTSFHYYDMAAFAYAWAPLERRWEADDFSLMQPAQPNPWWLVVMTFTQMIAAAGAKEVELQGSSSAGTLLKHGTIALEAIHGEAHSGLIT